MKMKLKSKYAGGTTGVKKSNAPVATGTDDEKKENLRTLVGQGQKAKKVGQEGYEQDLAERNARLKKYANSSQENKDKALSTAQKARNIGKPSSTNVVKAVEKQEAATSAAKKAPNKRLDTYVDKKKAAENKYKDDDDKNPNINRKSAITAIKKKGVKKMVLIKKK